MRPYHEYTPDQSFLLPPSLDELIAVDDPVRPQSHPCFDCFS